MLLLFNSSLTSAQFADCTLVFSIPITAGQQLATSTKLNIP